MNRKIFGLVLNDTDPFFVREFVTIFVGVASVIAFFNPFEYYNSDSGHFLGSLSAGVYISSLLYASVVSGSFARSIERGSLGYLMTMPIRRRFLAIHYVLQATVFTAVLFVIPFGFVEYLSASTIIFEPILFALSVTLAFLFLYNSIGFFVASVTKSSVFTTIFVFGSFFMLENYSSSIYPHWAYGQFILSGFGYFMNQQIYSWSLFAPLMLILIVGVIAVLLVYPVLRIRGLRSGRG